MLRVAIKDNVQVQVRSDGRDIREISTLFKTGGLINECLSKKWPHEHTAWPATLPRLAMIIKPISTRLGPASPFYPPHTGTEVAGLKDMVQRQREPSEKPST